MISNTCTFSLLYNNLLCGLISVPIMLSVSGYVSFVLSTIYIHLALTLPIVNRRTIGTKAFIKRLNAIVMLQSVIHNFMVRKKFIDLLGIWP